MIIKSITSRRCGDLDDHIYFMFNVPPSYREDTPIRTVALCYSGLCGLFNLPSEPDVPFTIWLGIRRTRPPRNDQYWLALELSEDAYGAYVHISDGLPSRSVGERYSGFVATTSDVDHLLQLFLARSPTNLFWIRLWYS